MSKVTPLMLAAGTCCSLGFSTAATAGLTWHVMQTTGHCTAIEGCIPPDPFDPSQGTLRQTDVSTDTSIVVTYAFDNFEDQDASLTFLVTGDWTNWDAFGHASSTQTILMPAFSSGDFDLTLSASESHILYGAAGSHDYGFEIYAPTWAYDVTEIAKTGDPAFYLDPQYHYGGASDVTLTYHYTTGTIPEPVSWALMLAGFGLVGATKRYGRGRPVGSAAL